MHSMLIHEGKLTDSFEVISGVRQGCILSLTVLILQCHEQSHKKQKERSTVENDGKVGRS